MKAPVQSQTRNSRCPWRRQSASRLGLWLNGSGSGTFALLILLSSLPQVSLFGAREPSWAGVPSFVLSGEPESVRTEVYEVASTRLADLVILSSGYKGGYRPGMLCIVHREGNPVAEILLVEVRDSVSAAIIREMSPGQVIQPGDAVQIKTVQF